MGQFPCLSFNLLRTTQTINKSQVRVLRPAEKTTAVCWCHSSEFISVSSVFLFHICWNLFNNLLLYFGQISSCVLQCVELFAADKWGCLIDRSDGCFPTTWGTFLIGSGRLSWFQSFLSWGTRELNSF